MIVAVLFECIVTICQIQVSLKNATVDFDSDENSRLLETAAESCDRFLSSNSAALKLTGLKALKELVQVKPSFALKHQKLILESLDSADFSTQRTVRQAKQDTNTQQ